MAAPLGLMVRRPGVDTEGAIDTEAPEHRQDSHVAVSARSHGADQAEPAAMIDRVMGMWLRSQLKVALPFASGMLAHQVE